MSVSSEQSAVERSQNAIARLQEQKGREVGSAASEAERASRAQQSALRSSSPSSARSYYDQARRHSEQAARHQSRAADIDKKIAQEMSRLTQSQKRLSAAQAQESRRATDEQRRAHKVHAREMQSVHALLREHDEFNQVAALAIKKLQSLPERITILFLASNPLNQEALALDDEARSIWEMISKAEHRDAVRFETRWAVRPGDLFQALNETRPSVVHFSGHGSADDEIVFRDDSGNAKLVSKEAIVSTIAAASSDVQLVFFNTCFSIGQAQAVVKHVPAAIGMSTSIGDVAARTFSSQFYSSIGFGLSVRQAFDQAKARIMLEGLREEDTPQLFITDGLNADELTLLRVAT